MSRKGLRPARHLEYLMTQDHRNTDPLPLIARDYIPSIVKKMRYLRRIRNDVRQELTDHFTDALVDYENQDQRNGLAQKLFLNSAISSGWPNSSASEKNAVGLFGRK